LGEEIVKYFKLSKNCGTEDEDCGSAKIYFNLYTNDEAYNWLGSPYVYKFITLDGMSWAVSVAGDCIEAWHGQSMFGGVINLNLQLCGVAQVDINGMKPPNRYGRDFFSFYITNGNGPLLVPWGSTKIGEDWEWSCGQNFQDDFCTARVIEEGWKMNY